MSVLPPTHRKTTTRYSLLRDRIFERYIRPASEVGAKLPSARQLAAEFDVNIETISKSLASLAVEGWVERRIGSGTYVSKLETERQLVGIFLGSPHFSYAHPDMRVYASIDQATQRMLQARDGAGLHYADLRIQECWETPHPALYADARADKLSALIVVRASYSNYRWIEELPVKTIGFGVDYGHSTVDLDFDAFATRCVDYLYQAGCRKIGMIAPVPSKRTKRSPADFGIHDSFHARLADHGLVSKPHWIEVTEEDGTATDFAVVDPPLFGYLAFQRIWQSSDRPDGLVIFSDAVGLGVVQAAADLGADLGRDIKPIFSSNLENLWPQFFDYPRMVFSEKEIARALIEAASRDTVEHHRVSPFLLPKGHGNNPGVPISPLAFRSPASSLLPKKNESPR